MNRHEREKKKIIDEEFKILLTNPRFLIWESLYTRVCTTKISLKELEYIEVIYKIWGKFDKI